MGQFSMIITGPPGSVLSDIQHIDHFDAEAFAIHAARVGDPLVAALGKSKAALRATFIDSFELMPDLYWSRDFLAQFQKRRGYDLKPYLPLIVQPGWMETWNGHYSEPYYDMTGVGARVREDYQQTVADLMTEKFAVPYIEWNKANGVKSRLQAHGAPWDLLKVYGLADIPETEDLENKGDPHFMRLARAAADIYGHQIVSAESLCWDGGRSYDVTPDEYRRRADLIFASGVNELVFHGVPYAIGDKWPGWYPFAPSGAIPGFSSMFAETNSLWPVMPEFTAYVTRTQSVLQQGRNVVPVAYYYGDIGYYHGIEDKGKGAAQTNHALIKSGYDYDRINPDGLMSAKLDGRTLVTVGGMGFSALVLPKVDGIDPQVASRIAEFAKAGLPILFIDQAPTRARGLADAQSRDKQVGDAVLRAKAGGAVVVDEATVPAQLKAMGVAPNLTFAQPSDDLVFIEKAIDQSTVYFISNQGASTTDASFDTSAKGGLSRWNAFDGSTTPIAVTQAGQSRHVALSLAAGESALLVFDPVKKVSAPAGKAQIATLALPQDGWQLQATGHGNKARDIALTLASASLGDWSQIDGLKDLSGSATYTRTIDLSPDWVKKGKRVSIDLGEVHDAAIVSVNGKVFRGLIGAPWTLDITSAVRAGKNTISVQVVNMLNNAMMDVKAPGFKNLKQKPAGLIGPVTLKSER